MFLDEAGKHIVQRYSAQEKKGRRHTSVVTVSVLPLKGEQQYTLSDSDISVTTQRGHGPGGQHQNKTDSAVRMVHEPTGIMVFINGRDQHANRREARRILESRVAEHFKKIRLSERVAAKRNQVGDGGRSGKRRTYNFINSRITDHLTGTKTQNIKKVMKGHFDLLK